METLLATSSAVSNAANLDTGLRTVDPCPGREVTSPLTTILSLESTSTSQPQGNQLNQSNEEVLAQVDQFTQNYEIESGHLLRVKGNLSINLVFWRSLGAANFILCIIENGHRLPFISLPLSAKLRNNKSARIHADFVDQAVHELLNSDRVRIVDEQPFVVNPLSVSVQPCGKKKFFFFFFFFLNKVVYVHQLEKKHVNSNNGVADRESKWEKFQLFCRGSEN